MGMLFEGKWIDEDRRQIDAKGNFIRAESAFRDRISSDASSRFPAEKGRYHLFVAHSCPWAHRTIVVRRMKGLEGAISMTTSDLPRVRSWAYTVGLDEMQPENGVFEIQAAYVAAKPDYTGRVTVPVLWDRKQKTIVNNESPEIIRMLNTEMNALSDDPAAAAIDLYPQALRAEIDSVNTRVYETVNNGVYRCGFAKSQEAYEEAFHNLFASIDWLEERLSRQGFIAGNRLTEADVRLYTTLIRFDSVYYSHFKCNLRRIEDYPNLSNYLRELYQTRGFGDTTDLPAIKRNYYGGMLHINPTGIVPVGPAIDYRRPHDRGRFPAG